MALAGALLKNKNWEKESVPHRRRPWPCVFIELIKYSLSSNLSTSPKTRLKAINKMADKRTAEEENNTNGDAKKPKSVN